jgi:multiple sugar transport system substrate-binding protein
MDPMGRKIAAGLLVSSMLLQAACSNAIQQEGQTEKEANPHEPAFSREPVELIFYDGVSDYSEERFRKEIGDPIKKKFPHITPKFAPFTKGDQVKEMLAAGQPPDIIFASSGMYNGVVNMFGMQSDIMPLIKKYRYDLGQIDEASVDMMNELSKGGMYALPTLMSPSPIYYNKDIFDKFGVPYPQGTMTWDETYELAKRLTRREGAQQYYGFMVSFPHLMLRNQFSLNLVHPGTEKTSFDDGKWGSMLSNITRFYQIADFEPNAQKLGSTHQRALFVKERTLAMWLPVSTLLTEQELSGMNWDMTAHPEFKELPGVGPQPYPISFYITVTNKHRDQSFEVISFLASEEYQLPMVRQGYFPTALTSETLRTSFGQDAAMYKGKNVQAMLPRKYAKASAFTPYNNMARDQLQSALQAVVLQGKDNNTALREAAEKANAGIKSTKGE